MSLLGLPLTVVLIFAAPILFTRVTGAIAGWLIDRRDRDRGRR